MMLSVLDLGRKPPLAVHDVQYSVLELNDSHF